MPLRPELAALFVGGLLLGAAIHPGAAAEPSLRVAIDPGHGGADAGCRSAGGLLEKDLTLDVARRLRDALVRRSGFEVVLIRDDDRSLTASERASAANTSRSELFLSVHANWATSESVSGFEVYHGSERDLDEEAAAASALEAAQASTGGGTRNPLGRFLWNLTQERYLEQSQRLGEQVHRAMSKGLGVGDEATRLPARGVRSQLLSVLNGLAMPAAVVELGYLSSPHDVALWNEVAFREGAVEAIGTGIESFSALYRSEPRTGRR